MPKSSFFSPRRLALLAMLTAASIVLSRLCVIYLTPTLAAMFIGLLAGLLRRWVLAKPSFWKSWSLTLLADVLAKMLWTTYWLTVLYGTAFLPLLAVRVPLYLVVSLVEGFVVFRLVKSGAFRRFCQLQPLPQAVPSTSK